MTSPSSLIERRAFLGTAAKLAAGTAIWPYATAEAFHGAAVDGRDVIEIERRQWGALLRLVAELGEAVSYGLISNALYDWLKSLSTTQQTQVHSDNRQLVSYGYIDPATRAIPIFGADGTAHCAYYPVLYPDQLNGLVSFYDFCNLQVNARIAVPSAVGLHRAVRDYARQTGSGAHGVAACFLPDRQSSASFGHFGQGYVRPDTYSTRNNSVVQINYTRPASNLGEIRVVASRDNLSGTREPFFDRSYYVNA